MKNIIYILYGSQTGNAQDISEDIYTQLSNNISYECIHMSLNSTIENNTFTFINNNNNNNNTNEETKINIIIVCSTTGNGDAPETANFFWRKLKNRNQPNNLLNGIEYAVLGLGDTNYDKFCNMGKNLDKRFNELGAKRFIELHCADEATDMEKSVSLFIEKVVEYFEE
jgi:sulfite reductase alpha subunit-like flavoprotein